jgi:DNA primase
VATWVDFDEIKAAVSLEQVLTHYGLLDSMAQKGKRVSGLCPFHPDSKTKSFKADLEKNLWNCFGACQAGGDVLALVCFQEGFRSSDRNSNRKRAALLLQERFGIPLQQSAPTPRQKTRQDDDVVNAPPQEDSGEGTTKERQGSTQDQTSAAEPDTSVNPPLTFELKNLVPEHPYLLERGLTRETIEAFGLGYFTGKRGVMQGRIVIPIHNEAGELVAYAGRWPGEDGWPEGEEKYKLPPGFRKSLVIFNHHRAKEHTAEGLIVVEGYFTVCEFWQRGRKNTVALMGSSMSPEQERLIVQTVGQRGRVLLMLDDDEAGRKGMADAAARLAPQVYVRTRAVT